MEPGLYTADSIAITLASPPLSLSAYGALAPFLASPPGSPILYPYALPTLLGIRPVWHALCYLSSRKENRMLYFVHVTMQGGPEFEDSCRSRVECARRLAALRATFAGEPVQVFARLSFSRPLPLPR